jgi:hypothetical protein
LPDACTVITQSDVSRTLGQNYGPPVKGDTSSTCSASYEGGLTLNVTVENVNQSYNDPGSSGTPVPGIGDRAVMFNSGPNESQGIDVWKGDIETSISMTTPSNSLTPSPALTQALKTLATTAAGLS